MKMYSKNYNINNYNSIIFNVDADNSSYDMKSFIDITCDIVEGVKDVSEIKTPTYYSNLSTAYDSASGSALEKKLTYFNITSMKEDKEVSINITINIISIM